MNCKQAQELKSDLDKALGKAQVLVSKCQHNADPGKNAELMKSLHQVGKDLERALNLLSFARMLAADIAIELIGEKAQIEAEAHEAKKFA